jgi:hypothetical protein
LSFADDLGAVVFGGSQRRSLPTFMGGGALGANPNDPA